MSAPFARRAQNWSPPGAYDSPSGLSRPEKKFGEPMSEEDIADAIRAFADAALAAKRPGFDAVELHGAHGYLIDQFFWGGYQSPPRILTEARTCPAGPGSPLISSTRCASRLERIFRSCSGSAGGSKQDYEVKLADTPRALEAWLKPLVDAGVDILHCSPTALLGAGVRWLRFEFRRDGRRE